MTGPAVDTDRLLAQYRAMLRIRRFEEQVAVLYREGLIPGFVHLCVGQEATAVGACWPLTTADRITSTHRGHGHCLAKGLDMTAMFAELFGREDGTCKGRGGSMHIADPSLGVLGANGIVGAGLPIAAGSGLASAVTGDRTVTVAFFGDGAVATGAFHEAVNLAAVWRLPVVFFCEDNHWAEFSPAEAQHPVPVIDRCAAYGVEGFAVDGNDVAAVAALMDDLTGRARTGEGPFLVVADTWRVRGHYEGDPQRYRSVTETDARQDEDPLRIAEHRLRGEGVSEAVLAAIDEEVIAEIAAAVAEAEKAPEPDSADLFDFVAAARPAMPELNVAPDAEPFRMMDAVHDALEHELEHDPSVVVAGIDVAAGNVFGLTRGLKERFPARVLDTPISETAIVGAAVGAAMAGLRPVVEIMYLDFVGVCLDQILNQAAKLRFMTGGRAGVPLTIRTQFGAGRSSGSQHSQSLEALLAHIPGLTVVMPSTPADTYGLLRAAIRDPNPVIVIEHRGLYGAKGPRPDADHLVPLGKAAVVRPGSHATVVAVSRMVLVALEAADELADDGIDLEVIDLRTVAPLDRATVLASVERTGRLLVAHEAVRDFGIGAELAALAAEEAFWHLDAPVARVGAPATPPPYAPSLEQVWLPDRHRLVDAARRLVER